MKNLLLILAFAPALLFSQSRKQRKALAARQKADQVIINNFKIHRQSLTNSNNALNDTSVVRSYIINQFTAIGLKPKGTNGYISQYKVDLGKQIKSTTFLKVNGELLEAKKDYFPLSYSAQKSVSGMPAMALRERGVPWFADVKPWISENPQNAASDINQRVEKEAGKAALKGATALFLYNSSNITDNIRLNHKDKTAPLPVPVIYITRDGYNHYFSDQSQILDIELNVAFEETIKSADHIAAFIDNGAASNIVIAAPYYNLFDTENENISNGDKMKNNADIVSGESVLIELAKMLTISKTKNSNYTFIAYRGEDLIAENGKWNNAQTNISSANYIINIGRVGGFAGEKKLLVKSYGAPVNWIRTIKPDTNKALEISFDSSSAADKDTSQHNTTIPVIDLFATDNNNFNGNSAISDNINYQGELQIARFIFSLVEATDATGKFALAGQ